MKIQIGSKARRSATDIIDDDVFWLGRPPAGLMCDWRRIIDRSAAAAPGSRPSLAEAGSGNRGGFFRDGRVARTPQLAIAEDVGEPNLHLPRPRHAYRK